MRTFNKLLGKIYEQLGRPYNSPSGDGPFFVGLQTGVLTKPGVSRIKTRDNARQWRPRNRKLEQLDLFALLPIEARTRRHRLICKTPLQMLLQLTGKIPTPFPLRYVRD